MSLVARWLLALTLIAALIARGGMADLVRPAVGIAIAIALVLAALGAHARFRVPDCGWMLALFAPVVVLCLIQALPLGWHHPWIDADLAALAQDGQAVGYAAWSIAAGATVASLTWAVAVAGAALVATVLFRGERAAGLADAVVLVGAGHALLGLALALAGSDWPSAFNTDRARGSFVYPNHAAAFWAACLPLALLGARARVRVSSGDQTRDKTWWRWGAAAVLALAVLLSGSRGGIIVATLVCLPLAFTLLPRRGRWWWATAAAITVGAWLAVIGLQDVGRRFDALRGPEGPSLDGRVQIWRAALPVIADAGALGSGAGTVVAAFRRSGDTSFGDATVNHLHSDPLEWTLEFGWIGAAAGGAGLLAAAWLLRPARGAHAADAATRVRWLGATLGLLVLGLHSCADFIWHNPAIDLLGAMLLVVVAQSRAAGDAGAVRGSGIVRLAMVAVAAGLAAAVAWSFPWERDTALTRAAGDFIAGRLRSRLPIDDSGPIAQVLAHTPGAAEAAALKAWLLRNLPAAEADRAARLGEARQALADAARLAPGDAQAWAQRAQLESDDPAVRTLVVPATAPSDTPVEPAARIADEPTVEAQRAATAAQTAAAPSPSHTRPDLNRRREALAAAVRRLLVWAPGWPEIQAVILDCARRGDGAGLSDDQQLAIVDRLLGLDLEQPPWFFAFAARRLGAERLSARLADAPARLRAAGTDWVSWHGELADWLAMRRSRAESAVALPPAWDLLRTPLYGEHACRLVLAADAPGRRAQAELLADAGLPIPAQLSAQLVVDGPPWLAWAKPLDLLDAETRARVDHLVRGDLHLAWAQAWEDRLAGVRRALDGDWSAVSRDSDPRLVAALVGATPPIPVPANEVQRCRLILARYRLAEWQPLADAGRWTWLYVDDAGASAVAFAERWVGVVIDGRWIGWTRGATDLAPLAGVGLHRIVVLTP